MDKKQQIVNLWRTCFGDSEAFISLYFDRVYKDENAMTIEKDGKIVSALQIVPYTMTYLGTEISVAYISGVCTAPEERGQGLMRQLLQETFEEMERREVYLRLDPCRSLAIRLLPGTGLYRGIRLFRGDVYPPEYAGSTPEDNGYPTGGTDNRRIVRLFQPQIT